MTRTTKLSIRRQLDPVKTRAGILEAGVEVFAEKGFGAASIADIAMRAGVAKSLVQYHFGSKEALWQACLADRAAPMIAALDTLLESGVKDLRPLVEARIKLHLEHPEVGRLLAWANLTSAPVPAALMERRERLVKHMGGSAKPDFSKLLFAIAATDGYFLFRGLYRKVLGDGVLDEQLERQLLGTILEVVEK